jgi:hypothetical protein
MTCHTAGFAGTPTTCFACHTEDFNQTSNPGHPTLGLSTDCASCHTTDPDWNPAKFDIHNDFYVLNGAHSLIANQCASCHQGDYTNTPTACVGCHLKDFNQTTDPSHTTLQFSTECVTCHSENAWSPANYDHDDQYFPIYSGTHQENGINVRTVILLPVIILFSHARRVTRIQRQTTIIQVYRGILITVLLAWHVIRMVKDREDLIITIRIFHLQEPIPR